MEEAAGLHNSALVGIGDSDLEGLYVLCPFL